MYKKIFSPGFSDTDALGHINNTVFPYWFENSRIEIFRIFSRELDLNNWPLILAKITIDFKHQCYYGVEVEVNSYIDKVGNSSFVVLQEVFQKNKLVAVGMSTMVHFDHKKNISIQIPLEIKKQLLIHQK